MRNVLFKVAALVWLLAGVWALAIGGSVHARAAVAQWLVAESWSSARASGEPIRPWPWADHQVIAQLSLPTLSVDRFVLDSDSGSALAFGPGYSSARSGPTMISGHRDTHFRFLGDVVPGTPIVLSTFSGQDHRFVVDRYEVVDSRSQRLPAGVRPEDLLLVTCYPLDAAVPGGPLRLVVIAQPDTSGMTR